MGFFNELITTIHCPNCNNNYEARIQFKFGATRQLEYRIGDKIEWGYNEIGTPGIPRVKVFGIFGHGKCPACNADWDEEFDIYLEADVITGITRMIDIRDYLADNEGCYHILT